MTLISVIVFAQRPDRIARLVAQTLAGFCAVSLHTASGFELAGKGRPACSVEAVSRLENLTVPGAVLILADQTAPRALRLCEDTIILAGADNRRMRRTLSGHLNPVVTCGTGTRDTLTLSSVTAERAVLCAQRELPTVSGLWLEPTEFAVELKGCCLREAMLAAGAAAVCGFDLYSQRVIVGKTPPEKEFQA